MPKKVSSLSVLEQPISWGRAFFCGAIASLILMSWIDIFDMMGFTHFNLEIYVGATLRNSTEYLPRAWLVGAIFNVIFGGIIGIFYAYLFEYIFDRSGARIGALLGLGHTLFAGFVILPFFETVHEQMGLRLFPQGIGLLGYRTGNATPIILLIAHVLFGAAMGLFYGPVRADRIRTRNFEPGEVGYPGEPEVITPSEDPEDATPSLPYHAPGSAFPRRHPKKTA
jgi:hypothetical protein